MGKRKNSAGKGGALQEGGEVEEENELATSASNSVGVVKAAKHKKPPPLVSALSGGFSGALIGPLDVLRTKMQWDSARGISRNMFATASEIVKANGIKGLWAGSAPTVIRAGLGVGINMTFIENTKALLLNGLLGANVGGLQLSALNAAITGGTSRAMTAFLLCPMTVVKTRMEYSSSSSTIVQPMKYKNTFHALHTIATTEGLRGLFGGLLPSILANAPFSALYYMFYTRLQSSLSLREDCSPTMVNLSSGVVAATGATLLTQPFDVIRTRVQLSGSVSAGSGIPSLIASIKHIVATQGAAGLLIGKMGSVF
eukprot:gene10616-12289_t